MDNKLLKKVKEAMSKAMIDFKADEDSIFDNEKETLKFRYENFTSLKKWKKQQSCIVLGCQNRSIERSHTIQKSGSIKRLAEKGHVLTPRFNRDHAQIEIIPIGINDASTFPGYCSEHERLFEDFESIKDFQTGAHLGLQLYRTVCREIVINEIYLKGLTTLNDNYKSFRNKKIREAILNNLGDEVLKIPNFYVGRFEFTNKDIRLSMGESKLKETKRYLSEFLYRFHDGILNDLSKKKFQRTAYKAIVFDSEVPVALAGRGNFNINLNSKVKSVEVIMNVLPLESKTYIFIATLKKYTKELDAYMNQFLNPLQIVNLIESWMIHGSDHWFIKPSIWQNIDKNYQKEILELIMDETRNIGHELEYSIFNELKMIPIKLMEDNYLKLNSILMDLLNKEKEKLTFAKTTL